MKRTADEMKAEALNRMTKLDIMGTCRRAFRGGKVWMSEGQGILYEISDPEILAKIKQLSKDGYLVYHAIHNMTSFGELYSLLYVYEDDEDWEMDNDDLASGNVIACVYNKSGGFDDFGSIGVKPRFGGLVRTY